MIRAIHSKQVPKVSSILIFCLPAVCATAQQPWKPNTDWGRWRLGHRADIEFLTNNRFTITFGSGAPNFETVSRKDFDKFGRRTRQVESLRARRD